MAADTDKKPSTEDVSDPSSPDYDPQSPYYEMTADSSSKYYVGPITSDDVLSGDDIREQANQTVDIQSLMLGWFGVNLPPSVKEALGQKMYERKLEESKDGLQDGLDMRDPGTAPKTQWDNATHEQMVKVITEDADPATVAESSEEWVKVGNELAGHQQNLADAINASSANWKGGGGDAAREHLANVGKWLGTTAQGATLSGRQQEIHSQSLNETQKAMAANPPVNFSVQQANAHLQTITDPIEYAKQATQAISSYREQQAAQGQAAQIMSRYDDTVGSAVQTPRFAAPPKLASQSGGGASGGGATGGRGDVLTKAHKGMDPTGLTPFSQGSPGSGGSPDGSVPGGGPGGTGGGPGGSDLPPGSTGGPGDGQAVNPEGLDLPPGSGGGPGGGGQPYNPGGIDLPPGSSGGGPGGGGQPYNPGNINLPPGSDPGTTKTSGYTPPPIPDIPGTGQPYNPGNVNLPPGPGSNGPSGQPYNPGNINLPPGSPIGTNPGGNPSIKNPYSSNPPKIPPIKLPPGDSLGGPNGKTPTIGKGGGINGESIGSRLGGGGSGGLGGAGGGSLGGGGGLGGGKGGSLGGGPATGAGGQGTPEEQLGGRGAGAGAGAKGAAGSPGMGGMGAGNKGGKGPEDKEHKIADYVESDDPSFFSADEVVAPPVIGDWKNTDWK
ncbi:hypothetical protein [Amycolatopsis jiangsuensis]|uniref:PPE family protein n=1 Tax=Amycolatopsis jiangsuensis TaxID=1181879 RepID=A0A840ILM8_9PSEU|nr:hypothetical protein [Amycolatopsis jiangsuensis]MBB4683241.1 hypothetical protein [Amycolatopsis jiangsuensis]